MFRGITKLMYCHETRKEKRKLLRFPLKIITREFNKQYHLASKDDVSMNLRPISSRAFDSTSSSEAVKETALP